MTDEEITRRLAEIEGCELVIHHRSVDVDARTITEWAETYDPLTDDQQCMALIKKYRTSVVDGYSGPAGKTSAWCAMCPTADGGWCDAAHESLNHAVCLAIIEAHNAPD